MAEGNGSAKWSIASFIKYGRQPDGKYLRHPNSIGKTFVLGQKHKKETIEKIRKKAIERNVPSEEMRRRARLGRGVGKSESTRKKMSLSKMGKMNPQFGRKGSLSPTWNGGVRIGKMIRQLLKYIEWKNKIFERDNFTCRQCFKRGGNLQVHHIRSFRELLGEFLKCYSQFSPMEDKETLVRLSESYEPFWVLDNGETLCEACHLVGVHHVRK